MGAVVGRSDGAAVGSQVGAWLEARAGSRVGSRVGSQVGSWVGDEVGLRVGSWVGFPGRILGRVAGGIPRRLSLGSRAGHRKFVFAGDGERREILQRRQSMWQQRGLVALGMIAVCFLAACLRKLSQHTDTVQKDRITSFPPWGERSGTRCLRWCPCLRTNMDA